MTIMTLDSIKQAKKEDYIWFSTPLNLWAKNTTVLEFVQGISTSPNENIQLCFGVNICLASVVLTSTPHLLFILKSRSG